MSNKLDERITRIRFDNDQFERGVATSMQSLDRLKNKLEATESVEAFSGITKSAEKTDLSGIEKAIDSVGDKFNALRMIAINVLSDIATQAINTGVAMVKNLSTDNIAAGWTKYDQELQAVQTIMVTLDDTPLEEVEKSLKKIGWYSDETSYSYEDMVGSMSKLISSGVSLEDATNAVIGLSSAAAAAGVSTKKATSAFYNFSQAFGAGYMQLQDWRSIEMLNMATPEFKQNIIDTAVELGKLVQVGEDLYATSDNLNSPDSWFNANSMRGSLKDKWFDQDVMNKVLGTYSEFANQVYEMQDAWNMDTASETMAQLEEMGIAVDNVSNKAFRAAQEAKTFAEAIDSVKDAVSTKWKDTFKELFGNYEEAKVLWTDLANELYDLFAASGDVRNEILRQWNDPLSFLVPDEKVRKKYKFPELEAGRDILIEGLWNIFYSIVNVVTAIKEAWREVFPEITAKKLYDLTKSFRDFTAKIRTYTENLEGFKNFLIEVFGVLKNVLTGIKKLIDFSKQLWPVFKKIGNILRVVLAQVWTFFSDAKDYFKLSDKISSGVSKIQEAFKNLKESILNFDENSIHLPTFADFLAAIDKVKQATAGFREKITNIFSWIREKFNQYLPVDAIDGISLSAINLKDVFSNLETDIKPILDNIKNYFVNLWTTVTRIFGFLKTGVKSVGEWLKNNLGGINLLDILGTTILGAMTWFQFRLALTLRRIGEVIEGISDVIWAFSKVLMSKAFELRIKALRNFGLAILAVAGAMYIVSKIDTEKLNQAAITIGFITIVLSIVAASLIRLQSKLKGGLGVGVTFKKGEGLKLTGSGASRGGIVGLVLGVLGMVYAVKMMNDMVEKTGATPERLHTLAKRVEGMLIVFATCVGGIQLLTGLGTKWAGGKLRTSTLAPVALASAMLIMIRVFEKIDKMQIENTGKVITGLIGIFIAIGVLSLTAGKISSSAGFGILAIVASIWLAVIGIKKLQNVDIDLSEQGPAILLVGGLILFLAWVQKFSVAGTVINKGQKFKKAQTNLVGIVAGLIVCIGAVYLLSKIPTGELFKGVMATLVLLGALFGGIYMLMGQASKMQNAKTMGTLGGLSILVIAIGVLVSIVTIAMHFGAAEVWQAAGVISVLFTFLSGILAASHKMQNTGKSLLWLSIMIAALGGVVTALYFMTKSDIKSLLISVGLVTVLLADLSGMLFVLSKINKSDLIDAKGILLTTISIMAILVIAVWALSEFVTNTDGLIKAAGAMAILGAVILATFAVVTLIGKAKTGAVEAAAFGSLALIITIIGIVTTIALMYSIIQWLSDDFIHTEALKVKLQDTIEIAYMMGSVISALIAGLFVGSATMVADALSDFAKHLLPFANVLSTYPSNFAEKVTLFGKALLSLSWFGLWSTVILGIGKGGVLERLAEQLKAAAGPIRDASIAFMNVNVLGLEKAIRALTAMADLASSMTILGAIFMRFKLGMLAGAINSFVKAVDPITEQHVTKTEYLTQIFQQLSELPTRERANIFSDQKSLLSMSLSVWMASLFLKGIVKRLGDLDTADLSNAKTNMASLVDIFSSISEFTSSLDKNLGVIELVTGSRETTLAEYMLIVRRLSNWKTPIHKLAELDNGEIQTSAQNLEEMIIIFRSLHDFAEELDKSGGLVQAFEGGTTSTLKQYQKIADQLPGVADAIILYGRKFLDPGNVTAITAANNVTNNMAEAFHNLVDQDLVSRLQAITQAIRELTESGVRDLPNLFNDEVTNTAIKSAIDNLVRQFYYVLLGEAHLNRIGLYFGGVIRRALDYISDNFNSDFYNKGASLVENYIRGIKSKLDDAYNIGINLANAVLSGAKSHNALDSNSPSKKMYDLGADTELGFEDGILSRLSNAESAGEAMGISAGLGVSIGLGKSLSSKTFSTTFNKVLNDKLINNERFRLFPKLVNDDTGEEETLIDALKEVIDPLKELSPDMENVLSMPWLQGFSTTVSDALSDIKDLFSPNGIQSAADGIASGAQATIDVLKNIPGLNDVEEIINDQFQNVSDSGVLDTILNDDLKKILETLENYFGDVKDTFGSGFNEYFTDDPTDYLNSLTQNLEEFQDVYSNDFEGFLSEDPSTYFEPLISSLTESLGSGYELPITPIIEDENGDQYSSMVDYIDALSDEPGLGLGKTVAGYTAEDVRALTAEIYHLEDALYSLKNAMQDQKVVHSGTLTIKYSNESDFVDRIQEAVIGNIRKEIRS